MSDDRKISASGPVGFRATLFLIAQRAEWDTVAHGEFFLGQVERTAKLFDTRDTASLQQPFCRVLSSLRFRHQERLHPVYRPPWFPTVNPGL